MRQTLIDTIAAGFTLLKSGHRSAPAPIRITVGARVALALGAILAGLAVLHPWHEVQSELGAVGVALAAILVWSLKRRHTALRNRRPYPALAAQGAPHPSGVRPLVAIRGGVNATSVFNTLIGIQRRFPGQRMLVLDTLRGGRATLQALRGVHVLARKTPVWVLPERLHQRDDAPLPLSLRLVLQGRFTHLIVIDGDAPEALRGLPEMLRRLHMESPPILLGQPANAPRTRWRSLKVSPEGLKESLRAPDLQSYSVDALRFMGDASFTRSPRWCLALRAARAGLPVSSVTVPASPTVEGGLGQWIPSRQAFRQALPLLG